MRLPRKAVGLLAVAAVLAVAVVGMVEAQPAPVLTYPGSSLTCTNAVSGDGWNRLATRVGAPSGIALANQEGGTLSTTVRVGQRVCWGVPEAPPASTPTTTVPPTTSTTVPRTTTTTTLSPTSTTTVPPSSGWPDASTTGVPDGVTLTPYTGSCTITVANTVIDAKDITCDLSIRAANVTITRSKLRAVYLDENSGAATASFSITDSEVHAGQRLVTVVGAKNFTLLRVEVTGGNRSVYCWDNCTITDSWVHGQAIPNGTTHQSGIRMGQRTTLRHNTIACDAPDVAPDGGCSAPLSGYGDFTPVTDNLIDGNLFKATTGGFCAYGGSSAGKPYSSGARDIRFVNNVFERGTRNGDHGVPTCGYYGAITDFSSSRPGNVWSNNRWDNGVILNP